MYQKTKTSIKKNQDRLNQEKMSVFSKIGMAIKLFFLYLAHSILHAFALLFTSPEKCFVMATNKDPKGTWSKSYYRHLLFQRRVRLYSSTSFFIIIIAVISASLAFNVIFPPTEIKFASAAGTTYTVGNATDNDNNTCVGSISLREALNCASNAGDIVDATSVSGTIPLTSSLEVNSNITVNSSLSLTLDASANTVDPAIEINGVSDTTINDMVIINASGDGIVINNSSSGVTINGCSIDQSTGNGIVIASSASQVVIDDCTISVTGGSAILLNNVEENTISNNVIGGSTGDGIKLTNSANSNTILDNIINNGLSRGINTQGSTGNAISGNTINNNTQSGIRLANSANSNTITGNTSSNSDGSGLVITDSSNNTISENEFFVNALYGIDVVDSSLNNTISENTIHDNITGGGNVRSGCTGNYFYQNIVTSQSDPYIYEDSLGVTFNAAIASSDNDIMYLDFSDLDVTTSAQVALGTEKDPLAEYLEDVTTLQDFQGTMAITDAQILAYNQACVLTMASDNTTFTSDCEEVNKDNTAPTVTISASGTTVTLTASDLDDKGLEGDLSPTIYYTTDGTEAITSSTLYTGPIIIKEKTTIRAIAEDWVENKSEEVIETIEIEEDTTAPVISSVKAGSITATTATITWATNEVATSQVLYGTDENILSKVYTDTSLVASHSIKLIGLDTDTKYYYKVKSSDASDNTSSSVVKDFTTATDTIPVILNPEEGDIVYTQKPTISGTAPAEASLNLYVDRVYHKTSNASTDGEFAIQTKKLSADEHTAKVKNNDSGEKDLVTFTVATTETTDDILLSGNFKNTSNTTNKFLPSLVGNLFVNGYTVSDFAVQVFIDDKLYGLADLADTDSEVASFIYEPFLKLDAGTHEAYFKVLRNGEVTTTGETRTFYVNGHSAPTLRYRQGQILINSISEDIVRLYLNGEDYKELTLDAHESGVAGTSLDVSTLAPGTYTMYGTARSEERAPESKESDSITFTVAAPATPGTTPVVEEEEEEVVIVADPEEVDTDKDGITDVEEEELGTDPTKEDTDGDGLTDEEEIITGTNPIEENIFTEEEIIKKKEIIFEEKAAEEEIPKQYPLIGEPSELTDKEQEELKDEQEKEIKDAVINIQTNGTIQEMTVNPATGELTGSIFNTLDIGDAFREGFGGKAQEQASNNLTFSGALPGQGYAILTLKSDPIVRIAEADENGQWTLSVPVDYLPEGEHTAYLQTEVNGVQTEQIQIARFVLQEQERFSNTTIFFIVNIAVAIFALLLAIFLQLRKNRKLIEEMEGQV